MVSTANVNNCVVSELPAASVCVALTAIFSPSPRLAQILRCQLISKIPISISRYFSQKRISSVPVTANNSTLAPASPTPTIWLSPLLPETMPSSPPIDVIESCGMSVVSTAKRQQLRGFWLPAASVCVALIALFSPSSRLLRFSAVSS